MSCRRRQLFFLSFFLFQSGHGTGSKFSIRMDVGLAHLQRIYQLTGEVGGRTTRRASERRWGRPKRNRERNGSFLLTVDASSCYGDVWNTPYVSRVFLFSLSPPTEYIGDGKSSLLLAAAVHLSANVPTYRFPRT